MLIAFEGPDKAGKSTTAKELTYSNLPTYNMTYDNYKRIRKSLQHEDTITHCFDRIDWFTHMVYRLALPGYEWNDERPRTVFAAGDVHLVFKLHKPGTISVKDNLYEENQLAKVNDMYYQWAEYMIDLNEYVDFSLFKTISIMQVDTSNGFDQELVHCSSPNKQYTSTALAGNYRSNESLHKFLQLEDHRIVAARR